MSFEAGHPVWSLITGLDPQLRFGSWNRSRQIHPNLSEMTNFQEDVAQCPRCGFKEETTNAVLVKLNQIGTGTKTIEAIQLWSKAGWGFVISHRSGETEDTFMADFAFAMGGGSDQERISVS